jgi:outer membrane murein-binding lipoprotein Lpp
VSVEEEITELATRLEELTGEVDEVRQQRDQDRKDVAAARTAVAHWNARLTTEGVGPTLAIRREIKKLREDLDQLRTEVARLSAAVKGALGGGKAKAPQGPRWDNLDQQQEATQLARLREWVDGVLRVQYPGYKLPDCWPGHREALWELGTLHAEWERTYADPRGVDLDRAEWFHERWLPGALARIDKAISTKVYGCAEHGGDPTGRRAAGR